MLKSYTRIIIYCILLFHAAITVHGFVTMFSDHSEWTLYDFRPFMQLLFTLVWAGICFQKRWCFFAYVSLMFYELAMKLFFGRYLYGEIFGDVFFPADLLFAIIILMLYKQHFNERPTEKV